MLAKLINFKVLTKNRGKLPVLFIGSVEQHGPYLPLGTDILIAETLSQRLEKKLGKEVVILPVLSFGCSKEHAGFPGTLSIEYSTYMLFIGDIVRSLYESGFKRVLLVSTHGGNNAVARVIQVDNSYASKIKVEFLSAFDDKVEKKCQEIFGGSEMHAGSSESSIIAFLDSRLVGFVGTKTDKKFAPNSEGVFQKYSTKEITSLGILNFSPKLEANSQKGGELLDFMAENLVSEIKMILREG